MSLKMMLADCISTHSCSHANHPLCASNYVAAARAAVATVVAVGVLMMELIRVSAKWTGYMGPPVNGKI